MMDYEVFKQVMAERIKDYLPPLFHGYEARICTVRKVNQEKDTLLVMPGSASSEKDGVETMPNLYLDDLYEEFQDCEDLDQVLRLSSAMILQYTGSYPKEELDLALRNKKDAVVMNLINTERNRQLLASVPHKAFLDLSVIYRIILRQEDCGLSTILITNRLMEQMELDEEELDRLARENTERMFPLKLMEMSDAFCVMTNEIKIHGATALLYRQTGKALTSAAGGSFFLLPSSVHEMIAVPEGILTARELLYMLEEGNRSFGPESEVLSDSIYHYDQKTNILSVAASLRGEDLAG
ncbi:DUF5688 family protein [bacterium 210820-DFI.6.37]|nr:DUF5688 family protein [bacterium 210820-DFI.6.37]